MSLDQTPADEPPPSDSKKRKLLRRPWVMIPGGLLTAGLAVVLLTRGLGGCGDDAADKKDKLALEKEKPKPAYEFPKFATQPGSEQSVLAGIKPGHWTIATLQGRANDADFRGELVGELVGADGREVLLDLAPLRLQTRRPAILPKAQLRPIDITFFAPRRFVPDARGPTDAQAAIRLLSGTGLRPVSSQRQPLTVLRAHQHYLVVLAREPSDYRFLLTLDSIRAPSGELGSQPREAHYCVVLPEVGAPVPLPSNALCWTTTAYIIWDDYDPQRLHADQQQALLDWLHWGGQLIVSGPETLATLQGSFLEAYLPVIAGGSTVLDAKVLAPLERWSPAGFALAIAKPWTGETLLPKPRADHWPLLQHAEQPLLIESRVGRGRVVVSAFRLAQKELANWAGYDGLFNACLLRRGPRKFKKLAEKSVQVTWSNGEPYDPAKVSRLRYFTRDAPASSKLLGAAFQAQVAKLQDDPYQRTDNPSYAYANPPTGPGTMQWSAPDGPPPGPGVAGWNDFSAASELARRSIREAAGIVVPPATFVLWIVAVYLAVLVPLNGALFRLLRRVEWAWAAAPIIAMAFAWIVVWLAQVDIGFARAQTEVALLEMQPAYRRAHLTRYTALYNSLGTDYTLRFADPTALALPLPTGPRWAGSQATGIVTLRRTTALHDNQPAGARDALQLEGFAVASNTTAMLHSEQMMDLGGAIRLEHLHDRRYRVANDTRLDFSGAAVVGHERVGWLGAMAAGTWVEVELEPRAGNEIAWGEFYQKLSTMVGSVAGSGLNLRPLAEMACGHVGDSEMLLIACGEQVLPGLSVLPSPSQQRQAVLLVAHLNYGAELPPKPDDNSRASVGNR